MFGKIYIQEIRNAGEHTTISGWINKNHINPEKIHLGEFGIISNKMLTKFLNECNSAQEEWNKCSDATKKETEPCNYCNLKGWCD